MFVSVECRPTGTARRCGDRGVAYSGEVYNFPELRTELRGHGHEFRTSTDTEDLRETLT
jgi:asparagine synthetase B (glutamine-hydrolysing)